MKTAYILKDFNDLLVFKLKTMRPDAGGQNNFFSQYSREKTSL